MALVKYATATVIHPNIGRSDWGRIRTASRATVAKQELQENLVTRAASLFGKPFNPNDYLLSHATIVASVDVFDAGFPTGSFLQDGFRGNRKFPDFRIKPECDNLINHNGDAWSRQVLLKAYPTFIGGQSFVEHVQIEDLSKGRIIDAVARDVGNSIYIDILVANDRKHKDLIKAIEDHKMSTLSMGCTIDFSTCTKCGHVAIDESELCFPPGHRVLLAGGQYLPIEKITEGDLVLTHLGNYKPVLKTMARPYEGLLTVLTVEGIPAPIKTTPNHPFWVLRPAVLCGCGCGGYLQRTIEHRRHAAPAFTRRYLPGHSTRVWNPNPLAPNNLSFEDFQKTFELHFDFVQAGEIEEGDFLAFPIPHEIHDTEDTSESNARLIGYFLAEGSFIKRKGKLVGVEFSFGPHELDTLAEEVRNLLDARWGREERRTGTEFWRTIVERQNVKTIKRRSTSRSIPEGTECPSCGAPVDYIHTCRFIPGRDDCYQCKVCKRQWVGGADRSAKAVVYPGTSVRFFSEEVAEWFYKYCGEYAENKKLHPEVLSWNPEIQKHILRCWMNGDGTQPGISVSGSSVSFKLISQMQVIAARCGYFTRRSGIEEDHATSLGMVVNRPMGRILPDGRDTSNWLPSYQLHISEPKGFGEEIRFSDPDNPRVEMSAITDGYKRVGNWIIYAVHKVNSEYYRGDVHNLEVQDDHSYNVEGMAVHNCPHVKYEKLNSFYDEQGQRHRVAELCGHSSVDPHGGVQFIEASWVGVPAFTGAVLRNILVPGAELSKKAEAILNSPPPEWAADATVKAAAVTPTGDVVVARVAVPEVGIRVGQIGDPRIRLADVSDDAFLAGWTDDVGGEEAPGLDMDAPIPDETPKAPEDPLKPIEDEIVKVVKDRVTKRLREELSPPAAPPASGDSSAATNSNVVKDAKRMLYLAGLNAIVRTASSDAHLIDAVAAFNTQHGINVPLYLYRTSLKVGSSVKYGSVEAFWGACKTALGRSPTTAEAKTLLRLGKLLARGRAMSGDFIGSRQGGPT